MRRGRLAYLAVVALAVAAAATAVLFWEALFARPDYWVQSIPDIGSSSSPRAVDLTGDGVLDIVLGGGGREFTATEFGVVALDGKDGTLLWSVPARNQVVGSPVFKDLDDDGTPDVIIGGRSAVLYAINGKTGTLFWEFLPSYDGMDIVNDSTILNFYTPQFVPDQDGDGVEDLLIAYGGFIKAAPDHTKRPPGRLLVISSKSGETLARADMPDGRETYMSPLVHDFEGEGELSVLFGSGGETINGHFYKASLSAVLGEDLSGATVLAGGEGKGFIAPPVLADVNGDAVKDVVVNAVNGKILCFDGATERLLWKTDLGGDFEGYTMSSPGHFDGDGILDFFVSYGHGIWPAMDFAYQVIVDGEDGSVAFADTAGTFQYASPLTFDFTGDGRDDAMVVINSRVEQAFGRSIMDYYTNEMRIFDPRSGETYRFHERKTGSNLGSTPLLTDLDGDGYLDVIYVYMDDALNFYSFRSAKIERIETNMKLDDPARWGAYMGPYYDGVYRERASALGR